MVLEDVKMFFCTKLELTKEKIIALGNHHFVIASEITN